ncbi:MAG TPA: LysR family transcriptional regulator substrate-binding protein [Candidatus Mailhella merdavium]|nr:LysR family transcriptional regulator substrate-binding protein [Candidatus Mailhella merdavium]
MHDVRPRRHGRWKKALRTHPRPQTRPSGNSVNNYHLMLRYVRQGLGVAIMDEMCLMASSYGTSWSGIVSYPLDTILPSVRCGILLRRHKHLSPQASALIEKIRSELPHSDPLPCAN